MATGPLSSPWEAMEVAPCPVNMLAPAQRNQLFDMLATIAWGGTSTVQQRYETAPELHPTPAATSSSSWQSVSVQQRYEAATEQHAPQAATSSSSWPSVNVDGSAASAPESNAFATPDNSWNGGSWGEFDGQAWPSQPSWEPENGFGLLPPKERKSRGMSVASSEGKGQSEFGGGSFDTNADSAWQAQPSESRKKEKKMRSSNKSTNAETKSSANPAQSSADKLAAQTAAAQKKLSQRLNQGSDVAQAPADKKVAKKLLPSALTGVKEPPKGQAFGAWNAMSSTKLSNALTGVRA